MAPGSSLRYEDTFSLLLGRDRCSDAFGSTASDETCSPSRTLCCVRQGQQYPSCQQALGKGWCCVGNKPTDNCYVDQPSVCEEQNSVPCTNLGEGIEKACCPRLTSCAPGTAARNDIVRCNIQYSDLERAAGWSLSSSAAVGTTSSTSSSTAAFSTSSTELSTPAAISEALATTTSDARNALQTSLPSGTASSQGQGASELSAGLIAGAAVGGTLGFVALLVLGYLILRRLLGMRQQTGSDSGYPPPPGGSQPTYGHHDYSQTTTAVGPAGYGYPPQSTEPMGVMANWKPVYDHQPKERVELPAAWGRPKPTELY